MDTKIRILTSFTALFIGLSLTACGQDMLSKSKPQPMDSSFIAQQQMLKDYFLCSCINIGFKEDSLFFKDASISVYLELLEYSYNDIQKVKQLAKQKINEAKAIEGEVSADVNANRVVFSTCIEHYRGKELDELVRSMKIKR